MKLYATTKSERSSKAQGGNEYLRVTFEVEHDNKERETIGYVGLERDQYRNEYLLLYSKSNYMIEEIDVITIKGAKPRNDCIDCHKTKGHFTVGTLCKNCEETKGKKQKAKNVKVVINMFQSYFPIEMIATGKCAKIVSKSQKDRLTS